MITILRFLKPYRNKVFLVCLLVILQVFASLGLPTVMADVVDIGIAGNDTHYIFVHGLIMLLFAALQVLVMVGVGYYSSVISASFARDMRRTVFSKVEYASLSDIDAIGIPSLITRTTNDITQIQNFIAMLLRMVLTAPIMFVGSVVMALRVDTQLSEVIGWILPFLVVLIVFVMGKATKLFALLQAKIDTLNRLIREHLAGTRVIRAFVTTGYERRRFGDANRDLTETTLKVQKIVVFLMPVMIMVVNLITVAVMYFGGHRIEAGGLQVGQLMSFVQYVMQIMMSISMLSVLLFVLPRASVSARRVREVLDLERKVSERTDASDRPFERGEITFEHVTFRYPHATSPVLRDVSFTAEAGKTTAIIGATGSGKTTILNLVERQYDIETGAIRIDGRDIRDYTLAALRSSIGYVPQKGMLFSASVADNIRYGKRDASPSEIAKAAATAQASDFIAEKENGFDEHIAQGGRSVSGGQRQRLAIARALVRKAPLNMFDDAFSALDFSTDAALRQALKSDLAGHTLLLVAQRINTIKDADCIVVLDRGMVVATGTHRQLLDTCSVYREIALSQLSPEELAV